VAYREFNDANGVQWEVWEVSPTSSVASPNLNGGWLAFQTRTERRRLAPVPRGWDSLPSVGLQRLLSQAVATSTPRRAME
jgi:hypothetical protein